MKAYTLWDKTSYEGYVTVVFAETATTAKVIALNYTDDLADARYINIRAKRVPELDKAYKGHAVMDWDNDDDRLLLVKHGFHCYEPDADFCEHCSAWEFCEYRVGVEYDVDV